MRRPARRSGPETALFDIPGLQGRPETGTARRALRQNDLRDGRRLVPRPPDPSHAATGSNGIADSTLGRRFVINLRLFTHTKPGRRPLGITDERPLRLPLGLGLFCEAWWVEGFIEDEVQNSQGRRVIRSNLSSKQTSYQ